MLRSMFTISWTVVCASMHRRDTRNIAVCAHVYTYTIIIAHALARGTHHTRCFVVAIVEYLLQFTTRLYAAVRSCRLGLIVVKFNSRRRIGPGYAEQRMTSTPRLTCATLPLPDSVALRYCSRCIRRIYRSISL